MNPQEKTAGCLRHEPAARKNTYLYVGQSARHCQYQSAYEVTQLFGGDWYGHYGLIPGPGHSSKDRSLLIRDDKDGRLNFHSYSGDEWRICRSYLEGRGIITNQNRNIHSFGSANKQRKSHDLAMMIWAESRDISGTIVETYLRSRGLRAFSDAPLRFHPACPRNGERIPAMIALMTNVVTNEKCGIHRTFLQRDGNGKAEGPSKMMLGNAKEAVVRLTPDENVTTGIGIAEGIETGLSLTTIGWSPVWATLSASGLQNFPILPGIEHLTVFSDHDPTGLHAAHKCVTQWSNAKKQVIIRTPLKEKADWNDIILQRGDIL